MEAQTPITSPIPLFDAYLPPPLCWEDVCEGEPVLSASEQTGVTMWMARPTVAGLRRLGETLWQAQQTLQSWPVARICRALDTVSGLWLDPGLPERRWCIEAIHRRSGLSRPMVAHAIDLEMRSSRLLDLHRTLRRELGEPAALDEFVSDPWLKGRTRAIGPGLIGGIFSSNIPALPHLTIMRSLLVKSACLGRSSAEEPLFLPLYLRTLERVAPALAACTAVLHWPHDDRALEAEFLSQIKYVIAYGGTAALQSLASRCPPGLRATWHGHKLGMAILMRSGLEPVLSAETRLDALADALAYDFSVFEQQACLAPQVLFIERESSAPRVSDGKFDRQATDGGCSPGTLRLARALVQALTRLEASLPPRILSPSELAARRGLISMLELDAVMGAGPTLISGPERLQGVVTVERAPTQASGGNDSSAWRSLLKPCPMERFVRIVEVDDWRDLQPVWDAQGPWLQNAAVLGEGPELLALKEQLAQAGCSRICLPGQLATPSMMWRHDGVARLSELVRWCDEELTPPG